jgi:hypothetical protein
MAKRTWGKVAGRRGEMKAELESLHDALKDCPAQYQNGFISGYRKCYNWLLSKMKQ